MANDEQLDEDREQEMHNSYMDFIELEEAKRVALMRFFEYKFSDSPSKWENLSDDLQVIFTSEDVWNGLIKDLKEMK